MTEIWLDTSVTQTMMTSVKFVGGSANTCLSIKDINFKVHVRFFNEPHMDACPIYIPEYHKVLQLVKANMEMNMDHQGGQPKLS